MKRFFLYSMVLNLFNGDGAGAAGAEGAGTQGETTGTAAAPTRRGKSGETKTVIYGKQEAPAEPAADGTAGSDAGSKTEVGTTSNTLEDRQKAYRDFINGEFKDLYTQDTQNLINRRFKETKTLQESLGKQQPIIDMLMQRYGVDDIGKLQSAIEDDDAYWSDAADEAGMSIEQYKQYQKLTRENEALKAEQRRQQAEQGAQNQLNQWYAEADALKAKYPSFDLASEIENKDFAGMLRAGISMEHAYNLIHMDEIMQNATATAAKAAEQKVVSNVRARGQRPAENGTSSQSAFTYKDDVSKLTRADRAEIARRVQRGEHIEF